MTRNYEFFAATVSALRRQRHFDRRIAPRRSSRWILMLTIEFGSPSRGSLRRMWEPRGHREAPGVVGIAEAIAPQTVIGERRGIVLGSERQCRSAPPAPDDLRRQQFLVIRPERAFARR